MEFQTTVDRFKKSALFLRLKEWKYRWFTKNKNKRMRQGWERFKACRHRKPRRQMRREMRLCRRYWRCRPLHYYRYDLFRAERQVSREELLKYIPEFVFYDLFLPCFNDARFEILLKDKILTEQMFRSLSIPQPHTICLLIRGAFYRIDLEPREFSDVTAEIEQEKYAKIFVKPVDGQGGYGILAFGRQADGVYRDAAGQALDRAFLDGIARENDFMIQAGFVQHPAISAVYPHSVNTFRIASENRGGRVRLLCSTMRIGREGKQVDNSAQDGLILKIDLASGRAGAPFVTSERNETFERHPDTGYAFADFSVPEWEAVKAFCLDCARKMNRFTYLGWDIALGRSGPVAIETNQNFAIDHYQVALGGLRDLFGIGDPRWWWKNRGRRIR